MITNEEYQLITKDIAGSRTKGRMVFEMFYGIKLIYDLYMSNESDFFVIFDYACDIEVGVLDKISFYQVKTKDGNKYSISDLTKKGKSKESILQKIINLKKIQNVDKLVIVSNQHLSGLDEPGKTFSNMEFFCFRDISLENKQKINKYIEWKDGVEYFDSIYYCVSDLALKKPDNSLLGYTTEFLETIYPMNPNRASDFLRYLKSEVLRKAACEFDTITLKDTIEYKGITKNDVVNILEIYNNAINTNYVLPFDKMKKKCEQLGLSYSVTCDVKKEYCNLFSKGYLDEFIKEELNSIKCQLESDKYRHLKFSDIINEIVSNGKFIYEYSIGARYCLAICAYERM